MSHWIISHKELSMRQSQILVGFVTLLSVAICAFPVGAQETQRPCRQIRAACEAAGFVHGKGKEGFGLSRNCIRPIMQATAQRPKASKPLPQVDTQIIAACKAANPNFGQKKHQHS
jgi:hypothetical protein